MPTSENKANSAEAESYSHSVSSQIVEMSDGCTHCKHDVCVASKPLERWDSQRSDEKLVIQFMMDGMTYTTAVGGRQVNSS
jgi:hypothetical protein